jgi:uncharacterized membrane protein
LPLTYGLFLAISFIQMKATFAGELQTLPRIKSVLNGKSMTIEKTVIVNRPVSEIYSLWRNLENLPHFMKHLKSVTVLNETHSHWVAQLDGKSLSWDAQIVVDRVDEVISWQSSEDSEIRNAGSVWFKEAEKKRGTIVTIVLEYSLPIGRFGAKIAKVFGKDAGTIIEKDLLRFKRLLKSGKIPIINDSSEDSRAFD